MDVAMELSRLLTRQRDIKKIRILKFRKIELKERTRDETDIAVERLCNACLQNRRNCPGPCEEYALITDPKPIEFYQWQI